MGSSGIQILRAVAADNVGVTKVEFSEGTTLLATDTPPPYSHTIQYTAADNGRHTYTARAYDAAGNIGTSSPLVITFNIRSDTSPHRVILYLGKLPPPTSQILLVDLFDDLGVRKVELYDRALLIATDSNSPFAHTVFVHEGRHWHPHLHGEGVRCRRKHRH